LSNNFEYLYFEDCFKWLVHGKKSDCVVTCIAYVLYIVYFFVCYILSYAWYICRVLLQLIINLLPVNHAPFFPVSCYVVRGLLENATVNTFVIRGINLCFVAVSMLLFVNLMLLFEKNILRTSK